MSKTNIIESLNIEYVTVFDFIFEAKMNLTEFHSQISGHLHGGATIAFGETVSGIASNKIATDNKIAVGQTITASHLNPKKISGYLIAKGKLLHMGKKSHVWVIEMFDEKDVLISHMTVTNILIDIQM